MIPKVITFLVPGLFLLTFSSCGSFTPANHDPDGGRVLTVVTTLPVDRIDEPSGIVFHPRRGTLFVVGDEGQMAEVTRDGRILQIGLVPYADFEGITLNPVSGLLYVLEEGANKILEVTPDGCRVLAEYTLDPFFNGELLLQVGKGGSEGISFRPDPDNLNGGFFFVVGQPLFGESDYPSSILEIELPLSASDERHDHREGFVRRIRPVSIPDISGLHYDSVKQSLFLISDFENMLYILDGDNCLQCLAHLPGADQEGLTFTDTGLMYIAQDSGGIISVR